MIKFVKLASPLLGLAMVVSFALPASAQTVAQLQAQIQALMAQISTLQGGVSVSATFTQNLTLGSRGTEVVALQQYLVAQGHLMMPAGVALLRNGRWLRLGMRWSAMRAIVSRPLAASPVDLLLD